MQYGKGEKNRFFPQESFVKPRGESGKAGMPTRQLKCRAGNRKHLVPNGLSDKAAEVIACIDAPD